MKKILIFILFIVACTLTACGPKTQLAMSYAVPQDATAEVTLTPQDPPIQHEVTKVTLSAVGDLMFHATQLKKSYDSLTGNFDFDDGFVDVEPYLSSADLTIGNLETTLADANNSRNFSVELRVAGYSGYPCFNTPDILAETIKDIGFDVLTTANNHSLDSGVTGLKRTLDILDANGLKHFGTYRTLEESKETLIVDVNGITFAFIGFTYAMNGFSTPSDEPYIINSLDMYLPEKQEQMCALVRAAKELSPDFIVIMPHFGNEYWEFESTYQRDLVDALFAAGADIVLGSHPHVLEPIEIRKVVREDGTQAQCFVIYSMGNFISSQKVERGMNKDLGVILSLEFEKTDLQKPEMVGFSMVPTYTYWSADVIGVLPVDETLEKIESNDRTMPAYDISRLEFAKTYSIDHLMSYLEDYDYEYQDYRYTVVLK